MYQVLHLPTKKVIDLAHSEKEGQRLATAHFRSILSENKYGRRTLSSLGNIIPWKTLEATYVITEMIGVWIDTDGGKLMPESTSDEENDVIFIDQKGNRHIGMFDAEEGLYLSALGITFAPEKVVEFLILPEPKFCAE